MYIIARSRSYPLASESAKAAERVKANAPPNRHPRTKIGRELLLEEITEIGRISRYWHNDGPILWLSSALVEGHTHCIGGDHK
jgi:hypothetical protein